MRDYRDFNGKDTPETCAAIACVILCEMGRSLHSTYRFNTYLKGVTERRNFKNWSIESKNNTLFLVL